MENFRIRYATREDIPLIYQFIKDIAEYEKMLDQVVGDEKLLEEWLYDKNVGDVIFAMEGDKEVGFALFFHNFSTFLCKGGIYLEDLFVKPEYRKKGYGKALLTKICEIANERNCGRVEWVCLNWNINSINFYKSMGAISMDDWTTYRMCGEALDKFKK